MASPQRSVLVSPPISSIVVVAPVAAPVVSQPGRAWWSEQPAVARSTAAGRGPGGVAPWTARSDGVRPAGRPARLDGVAAGRPVRGGSCVPARASEPSGGCVERGPVGEFVPVRLTRRGRRVLSGLSIGVGLCIAVVTAGVQLAHVDGGLQLAGSSTVVVRSGDTLWSLAQELAPDEDPRAVVDAVVDLNGLQDVDLVPGMVLQLP